MPTNPAAIKPVVRSPCTLPVGRVGTCWSWSLPLRVESTGVCGGPRRHLSRALLHTRANFRVAACRLAAGRGVPWCRQGLDVQEGGTDTSPELGLQLEPGKRACYQKPGCRSPPGRCISVHRRHRVAGTVCVAPCNGEAKAPCALPAAAFWGGRDGPPPRPHPDPSRAAGAFCRESPLVFSSNAQIRDSCGDAHLPVKRAEGRGDEAKVCEV